jgi:hypothetical protein
VLPLPDVLAHIHPAWRERLLAALVEADAYVESGWRSSQRQQELYDGWQRRLPGYNPANRPGTSNHEAVPYGEAMSLAADVHPNDGNYGPMKTVFEKHFMHFPIASEKWHAQPWEQWEGWYDAMPVFAVAARRKDDDVGFGPLGTATLDNPVTVPIPQKGASPGGDRVYDKVTVVVGITGGTDNPDLVVDCYVGTFGRDGKYKQGPGRHGGTFPGEKFESTHGEAEFAVLEVYEPGVSVTITSEWAYKD